MGIKPAARVIAQHEPEDFTGPERGTCGCRLSKSCKRKNKNQYRCQRCNIVVCTSCRHAHSLFHLETILRKLGIVGLLNTRLDEALKNDVEGIIVDGLFDGEDGDDGEDAEPPAKKSKK